MQHGYRLGCPPEVEVALVAGDQRIALTCPRDDLRKVLDRQYRTVRVRRRVDPDEPHACRADRRQRVRPDDRRTRELRTDGVGRVSELGNDDDITVAHTEQPGQQRDHLFGTNGGKYGGLIELDHGVPAAQHPHERRAKLGRAGSRGVRGSVGGGAERLLHHLWSRVNRCPDGQVDDAVGMTCRECCDGRDRVPGKVGKVAAPAPEQTQCSVSWGGSAATTGWSFSILPTFEAPPGDPSSSKKSTLTL